MIDKRAKHIGSSFDDFLEDEDIKAEVDAAALKWVMTWLLRRFYYVLILYEIDTYDILEMEAIR